MLLHLSLLPLQHVLLLLLLLQPLLLLLLQHVLMLEPLLLLLLLDHPLLLMLLKVLLLHVVAGIVTLPLLLLLQGRRRLWLRMRSMRRLLWVRALLLHMRDATSIPIIRQASSLDEQSQRERQGGLQNSRRVRVHDESADDKEHSECGFTANTVFGRHGRQLTLTQNHRRCVLCWLTDIASFLHRYNCTGNAKLLS